ncbi:hypothetical protein D3C81_2192040 [compost metagenome]
MNELLRKFRAAGFLGDAIRLGPLQAALLGYHCFYRCPGTLQDPGNPVANATHRVDLAVFQGGEGTAIIEEPGHVSA